MAGGAKVKVRKVSLAVNSPARRKVSKPNTGLNALPPFQWSSTNNSKPSTNSNNIDRAMMPPPVITRGFKTSGVRKLVEQYAQVSNYLV